MADLDPSQCAPGEEAHHFRAGTATLTATRQPDQATKHAGGLPTSLSHLWTCRACRWVTVTWTCLKSVPGFLCLNQFFISDPYQLSVVDMEADTDT